MAKKLTENQEMALAKNPKKQLIVLENGCTNFTSKSGKNYFVEYDINEISLRRYEALELHLVELNFSATHESLTKHLLNAIKFLKDGDVMSTHLILHNIVSSMADLRTKNIITMWVCSVFIYRENEDIILWDKNVAQEKINDWKDSFATGFFLQLRNKMFQELEATWSIISQAYSVFPKDQNQEIERMEEVNQKFGQNPS